MTGEAGTARYCYSREWVPNAVLAERTKPGSGDVCPAGDGLVPGDRDRREIFPGQRNRRSDAADDEHHSTNESQADPSPRDRLQLACFARIMQERS